MGSGLPLNIDWQQILLHLFNFVILAGILYLLLYKPIKDFMKKRGEHYVALDEEAKRTLEEALAMKKEYEEKLALAETEIEEKRAQLEDELEAIRVEQIAHTREEADEILKRARISAQREHDDILANISEEVKEMAVSAAEKAVIESKGNPFDAFLHMAERSMTDEHSDTDN